MDELVNATAGGVGAAVATLVVYPLDVAKTQMQAAPAGSNESQKTMIQVLAGIMRKDGLLNMLATFPVTALQQASSRFTYYYLYEFLLKRYRSFIKVARVPAMSNLLLGYIAGVVNVVFISPLETIATRAVASQGRASVLQVCKEIIGESGLMGFYYGWTTTFYTSSNPAIQNTCFDQVRARLLGGRSSLSFLESWLLGAFSKAAASFITYPHSRVKAVLQNKVADDSGVSSMLLHIYSTEGLLGIYSGLQPTLLKSVLQSAFMLMVKEKMDNLVRRAVVGLAT